MAYNLVSSLCCPSEACHKVTDRRKPPKQTDMCLFGNVSILHVCFHLYWSTGVTVLGSFEEQEPMKKFRPKIHFTLYWRWLEVFFGTHPAGLSYIFLMESIAKISRRCVPGRVLGTSEAHIGVGETGSCTALESVFSIFQLAFDLFRIIMIDSESVCLNLEIERNLRSNMQIPTRCSTFHGLVFGHKRTGLDLCINIEDPHAGPHSQD